MSKTEIQWTDFTWNPVTGCNKISAGCKNCYAESIANRFWKDRKFTDVVCHEDRLGQPLKIKKPSMIFVNSMSDLFHEKVPFTFIDSVYEIMGYSTQHIFQILTKRPERALEYYNWTHIFKAWGEWDNIWLGVSVENQETANKRIPLLQNIPAKIRFLSVEPMLEEIKIGHLLQGDVSIRGVDEFFKHRTNWVIIGCESGAKKRECKIEWVEKLVKECREAPIPTFVKQLQINDKVIKNIYEFPKHLQIRNYPL